MTQRPVERPAGAQTSPVVEPTAGRLPFGQVTKIRFGRVDCQSTALQSDNENPALRALVD
ncbi:TPA: hypothetical protein ACOEN0_004519, partial [Stenotrophomonas maltophilia]